ncbi:MAG: UbiA family prenyltransferase [Alphaproteobacteria bacterium]|nr:UbiA family prenyltransferase [Alphaproteobacteria bacterium]MBV9372531.1 UbiA family prenyltransferase [Alphaproteobacteria bacterium]MBV9902240.1 UbiA family prenyltransferase [Alphaproteobacteria bacterium]
MAERISGVLRSGEWWDYKLVPILSAFYGSAIVLRHPIGSFWPGALVLLLSLIPGAAYVSIVNDLTDIDDDAAAGKANRMASRSTGFRAAALLATLAAGAAFFWVWRGQPLLLAFYAAAWIAFTLYSVPPVRLKTRGLAGVAADSAGAHLFPTLLAAAVPFTVIGVAPEPVWLAAVALWSFAYGFRGNLWHQLLDRDSDRAAGVGTFGARHSRRTAARLGAWVAFPLELVALAVLLHRIDNVVPMLFLAAYALLVYRRVRLWNMKAVLVAPRPGYLILLHEYYDAFLPLALLLASALVHPFDWVLLSVHLCLFHRRPLAAWQDGWRLVLRPLLQRLRILGPPAADSR